MAWCISLDDPLPRPPALPRRILLYSAPILFGDSQFPHSYFPICLRQFPIREKPVSDSTQAIADSRKAGFPFEFAAGFRFVSGNFRFEKVQVPFDFRGGFRFVVSDSNRRFPTRRSSLHIAQGGEGFTHSRSRSTFNNRFVN